MHTYAEAQDLYHKLKQKTGKAELVTANAICTELGEIEFAILKAFGFIEHCRVDELGRHWYAI